MNPLKHKIISLIALVAVLLIFILYRNAFVLLISLIVLIYLACIIYGSFQIKANYFLNSINKGVTDGIALSFDDGPDPEITPKILKILRENNVKASFFVIGKKIEMNPEILTSIAADGHIIANHSYEHDPAIGFWTKGKLAADLEKCSSLIAKTIGKKPLLFRPPFGVTNPRYASVLKKLNLTSVGWSGRSLDTVVNNKKELLQRVIKSIKNGTILLFHDTQKITLEILPDILEYCNKNGIKIVPLQEFINQKPYETA